MATGPRCKTVCKIRIHERAEHCRERKTGKDSWKGRSGPDKEMNREGEQRSYPSEGQSSWSSAAVEKRRQEWLSWMESDPGGL